MREQVEAQLRYTEYTDSLKTPAIIEWDARYSYPPEYDLNGANAAKFMLLVDPVVERVIMEWQVK